MLHRLQNQIENVQRNLIPEHLPFFRTVIWVSLPSVDMHQDDASSCVIEESDQKAWPSHWDCLSCSPCHISYWVVVLLRVRWNANVMITEQCDNRNQNWMSSVSHWKKQMAGNTAMACMYVLNHYVILCLAIVRIPWWFAPVLDSRRRGTAENWPCHCPQWDGYTVRCSVGKCKTHIWM